jgi:DNA-nicking Smr family endonuclease
MGKRRAPLIQGGNPKLGDQLRYKLAKAELDLHGKTVAQANRAVRSFLQRMAHHHPADIVRIITGRGASSEDEPVLGPALERQLGELSEFVSEWQRAIDGGSYVVRLT